MGKANASIQKWSSACYKRYIMCCIIKHRHPMPALHRTIESGNSKLLQVHAHINYEGESCFGNISNDTVVTERHMAGIHCIVKQS